MPTLKPEARNKLFPSGPPGHQDLRMCKAAEGADDGVGGHYWNARTGEEAEEPGRVSFTPEQPCPEHAPEIYEEA